MQKHFSTGPMQGDSIKSQLILYHNQARVFTSVFTSRKKKKRGWIKNAINAIGKLFSLSFLHVYTGAKANVLPFD